MRASYLGGSGSGSEVAVRILAKGVVIQVLDQGFQGGSHTWYLAEGLSFLPREPLHRLLKYAHVIVAGFSQSKRPKDKAKKKPQCIL